MELNKVNRYTPGPWNIGQGSPKVYARNHAICGANGLIIGKALGFGYPVGIGWSPESEANARLMAAAPELLEALTCLLNCPDLNLDELEPETIEAIKQGRAAIMKAEAKEDVTESPAKE